MGSSSSWIKYVIVWSIIATVSSKVSQEDTRNDDREEKMEYAQPSIVPTPMAYYGFQYPFFVYPGWFVNVYMSCSERDT